MLEIIPAPDGVVAMRASGRLDEADIERAITAVEAALAARDRITIYAEVDIAGITPGGLMRDLGYGLSHLGQLRRFARAAVVTNQDWVRWIAEAENAILPWIEVRAFAPAEKEAAMAWASEPLPAVQPDAEPAEPSVRRIETNQAGVVAFEIDGKVGADDVRKLIALFDEEMSAHERLRVLLRFRRFDGATLSALREPGLLGAKMRAWRKIDRYALVGGPSWLVGLTTRLAPMLGIETRHFELGDEAEAWRWLGAEPVVRANGSQTG
jgi:hypothetical protein